MPTPRFVVSAPRIIMPVSGVASPRAAVARVVIVARIRERARGRGWAAVEITRFRPGARRRRHAMRVVAAIIVRAEICATAVATVVPSLAMRITFALWPTAIPWVSRIVSSHST